VPSHCVAVPFSQQHLMGSQSQVIHNLFKAINNDLAKAFLSAFFLSFAQIELKIVATRLGGVITLLGSSIQISQSLRILHGLLFFVAALLGVVFWIAALRNSPLSSIYWTTSICYLLVPVFSKIILGDSLTLKMLAGYAIIVVGLVVSSTR
jgi:hypothetical protein